jgi:hypothetical protein
VSEVISGKPFEVMVIRELAWIESILGADTNLQEITQTEITKVRNERRVMTTKRCAGKDQQGRPLQELISHWTVNRTMQTFRAALYHARDDHEAFIKPNLRFGINKEDVTKHEVSEALSAARRVTWLAEILHLTFMAGYVVTGSVHPRPG